tara:strand:- start:27348 stop:27671 length:324 start_codon:yes stop_codon:yes gene_type:complete
MSQIIDDIYLHIEDLKDSIEEIATLIDWKDINTKEEAFKEILERIYFSADVDLQYENYDEEDLQDLHNYNGDLKLGHEAKLYLDDCEADDNKEEVADCNMLLIKIIL